jgi:hypothetical protein
MNTLVNRHQNKIDNTHQPPVIPIYTALLINTYMSPAEPVAAGNAAQDAANNLKW